VISLFDFGVASDLPEAGHGFNRAIFFDPFSGFNR
jgi:hypothetical protein